MAFLRRMLAILLSLAVFAGCLCVLAPINVSMPRPGLDESWMLGMSSAVAQGLQVGRDLVFTGGPYSAIYSHQYHPAIDRMVVTGGLLLCLGFAFFAWLLSRRDLPLLAMLALCMPYAAWVPDAAFGCYALFAAAGSLLLAREAPPGRTVATLHLLALSGLGLLVAVKVSFLWFAAFCAGLSAVALLWSRRPLMAGGAVLGPAVALVLAWAAAGQKVAGIGPFLASAVPITAGYTEAMASNGDVRDLVAFAVPALLVLAGAVRSRQVLLLALLAAFLFIQAKAGFVRHDGHALAAGMAAVLAAFALRAVAAQGSWPAITAGVAAFLIINAGQGLGLREVVVNHFIPPYRDTVHAARMRLAGALPGQFDAAMAAIRQAVPLPVLTGTTDLYTLGTAALLASGNRWNPRPVLQSYSAYTPALQWMDADHLKGNGAPDHLLFSPDAIDSRLPALEDGPSWPVILQDYRPTGITSGFVVLDRRPGATGELRDAVPVSALHAQLDTPVAVPPADGLVVAAIRLHRGWRAKLAAALFKPAPLFITLSTADGNTRRFRFIGSEAEGGFVLSPLIETAADFALAGSPAERTPAKQVMRFAVSQRGWWGAADKFYDVALSTVALPPPSVGAATLFDAAVPVLPGPAPLPVACTGAVDQFNGADAGAPLPHGNTLGVMGWLALDVRTGALPDAVWVTMAPPGAPPRFVAAHPFPRPDVGAAFKQDALARAGYRVTTYAASLHGPQEIGLAYTAGGRNYVCTNLQRLAALP